MLVHRVRGHDELECLRNTFRRNGCSNQQIVRLSVHQRVALPPEKPTYVALLPFVSTTLSRISQMLSRHNIKSLDLTLRKVHSFLQPMNAGRKYFSILNKEI
jgi:hypothetical protein